MLDTGMGSGKFRGLIWVIVIRGSPPRHVIVISTRFEVVDSHLYALSGGNPFISEDEHLSYLSLGDCFEESYLVNRASSSLSHNFDTKGVSMGGEGVRRELF